MNFNEKVLLFCLAIPLWYGFTYMVIGSNSGSVTETTFVLPVDERMSAPLKKEVDFLDTDNFGKSYITDVHTEWGTLFFSTDGATIDSIDFKRKVNGNNQTIRALTHTQHHMGCFTVALDKKTPCNYSLISGEESEDQHILVYSSLNDTWEIKKTFIIDKNNPKIDLIIDAIPYQKVAVQPTMLRIFFASPYMADIKDEDIVSTVVVDQAGRFIKTASNKLESNRGWLVPQMFGTDSRYFVYSLITDVNDFTQRAYYKIEDQNRICSILEGPKIDTQHSWQLSFYFGPKDITLIDAVDSRLENTLDYSGILSLLSKFLLKLIKLFYSLLHNYGFAIIAVTLLIQLFLLPLSLRNGEEQFKKQQIEYQRKLAIIQQRFKNEPDKLAVEQAQLLRTHGMPSLGCLIPLLIQIPIFVALNRVLSCSFELYQAPMLWIKDLSVRDPYYILPFIITLAMLVPDGKFDATQQRNKMMMAFVFGAITSSLSAGLALYIAAGRIFGLLQSRIIKYFNMV